MTFLPHKLYVNGADAFHLMLERSIDVSNEGNNQLYLCVQLTSELAFEQIKKEVDASPLLHWIANIRLRHPLIGVSYYRYKNCGNKLTIHSHGEVKEQFPTALLHTRLLVKRNEFLHIHHYLFEEKHYLLITYHHLLFDGKGAGMLLQHMLGKLPITPDNFRSYFPSKLKWKNPVKQWLNLMDVKKTVEATNRGNTTYLTEKTSNSDGFHILSHVFTQEETQQVKAKAQKNGVRFGLNFFQVACVAKTYHALLANSDELWVPIPYNGRKRGAPGSIISNHTSFIFHRLKVNASTSLQEISNQLQEQMNEQLKDKLPEKYNDLLQLMRFFPTWFNHLVTFKSSKGKIASFLYSSTEIGENQPDELIEHQWILPPFSYPPGFTVNFYTTQNQLHFHITYSRKIVENHVAETFYQRLITELKDI